MKNKILIIVLLIAIILFNGCAKEKEKTETIIGDPVSAFKQFGLDLEKIKPNMGTEKTIASANNNYTIASNESIYNMKADWTETVDEEITDDVRYSYNKKMFDYTASISDDKINHEHSSSSSYLDEKKELNITDYSWCYIYNGVYIDVYSSSENEIGLSINTGSQHN